MFRCRLLSLQNRSVFDENDWIFVLAWGLSIHSVLYLCYPSHKIQHTNFMTSRIVIPIMILKEYWNGRFKDYSIRCIILYNNIVLIHFYSASHSTGLSEVLPITTTDTVSEFTRRSATGNCKWRTCPRSLDRESNPRSSSLKASTLSMRNHVPPHVRFCTASWLARSNVNWVIQIRVVPDTTATQASSQKTFGGVTFLWVCPEFGCVFLQSASKSFIYGGFEPVKLPLETSVVPLHLSSRSNWKVVWGSERPNNRVDITTKINFAGISSNYLALILLQGRRLSGTAGEVPSKV